MAHMETLKSLGLGFTGVGFSSVCWVYPFDI